MPSMSNTASTGSSRARILHRGRSRSRLLELAQALRHRRGVHVLQVVLPVDHRRRRTGIAPGPPASATRTTRACGRRCRRPRSRCTCRRGRSSASRSRRAPCRGRRGCTASRIVLDLGMCVTTFSARSMNRSARRSIRSTLRLPGKSQSGTLCSPRPAFGQRMRLEVLADRLVQLEEPQRVPVAARHVVVGGLARRWWVAATARIAFTT